MCALIIRSPVMMRRPMLSFNCSFGIDSQRCRVAVRSAAMGVSPRGPWRDHRDLRPSGQSQKKNGGPVDRPGPPRVRCSASYCRRASVPDLATVVLLISQQVLGAVGAEQVIGTGELVLVWISAMLGCAL